MQAALSSAAYWKGFDNEKGDCVICNAESPCALVSSSAFRARKRESLHYSPLTGSWSAVLWHLGFHRGDSEIISGCLPSAFHPRALWFSQSGSGMSSSSDQWFLMEERSWTAWGFRRTQRFWAFFSNQSLQFHFYDAFRRTGVIPRISHGSAWPFWNEFVCSLVEGWMRRSVLECVERNVKLKLA